MEIKPILEIVTNKNWAAMKTFYLYFRIRRGLSVTPLNCLVYDNRLVILSRSKQEVLESKHNKNRGRVVMIALSKLVWWPRILSKKCKKPRMQELH